MKQIKWLFKKLHIKTIWDFLAWFSLASILFWALAKGFGWINTPELVEMYPIIAAVFFAGKFYQDINNFKEDHEKRLIRLENRLEI